MAFRATARTSVVFFTAAFAASALRRRWPNGATAWMLRNRRQLGVSYAASHFIHLLLILAVAGWTVHGFMTVRPMLTIVEDTTEPQGIHDTHIRMCNAYLYEIHGLGPGYKGCFEIVSEVIAPYGIAPEDIPDPFNIFLNLQYDCDEKKWVTREPVTRPGDYIEFRADMDCLAAISKCPEDKLGPSNAYRCTPIQVQVYDE